MALSPVEFEDRLARYGFESAEESRAVRVGEKELSEQAAIVARYADLFTEAQLDALRSAEESAADPSERERLYRLAETCREGVVDAALAEREDALTNAVLAARVPWSGEELPLRTAQARLATIESYEGREGLHAAQLEVSVGFNEERGELMTAREELDAELSGADDPVARHSGVKGIALTDVLRAVEEASVASTAAYDELRGEWLDRLLGVDRSPVPTSAHTSWIRRLSPLAGTYTKEKSVPVCSASLAALGFDLEQEPGIRPDLEDRPQKSPRACVIASDPPRVVHLITRAQGGLHDYEAFLHEAGHALHYAGCDPELPYTYRRISRDHALTEIYSYLLESVAREPGWHALHFGLSDAEAEQNAEAMRFVEALMFRRYAAKLGFEIDFWGRFPDEGPTADGFSERLTAATGILYPSQAFLTDIDPGFYSADYLRAWIRSAQVREYLTAEIGDDWWRDAGTGVFLRELFRRGTQPTSEEVAAQVGYDPYDVGPLVAELHG